MLTIAFSSFILTLNYQRKIQARNRTKLESTNLSNILLMALSKEERCKESLVAGYFGTTLTEFQNLATKGQLRIRYLPAGSTEYADLLAERKKFQSLTILNVEIANPLTVRTTSSVYIANINVKISDDLSASLQPVLVPFYLVTDATGTLISCRATSYPDEKNSPGKTMEDFLCQTSSWPRNKFDAKEHVCISES